MPEPITVPVETDPDELATIAFDFMESVVPGWNRSRGDQASQVIASCARIMAEGRDTASDVSPDILLYLGQWVDGLAAVLAIAAQTTATVTALDAAGYTVHDGDRFLIRTSGDSGEVFIASGDVAIPPGSTSTTAGGVLLVAETPGAAGSDLPADSDVEPVESLSWVASVALTAPTSGGIDAETTDEYLARWIALRELAHDSPTRAADSAALLLAVVPGIDRALALDGYDPVTGTYGNEKYVGTAVADAAGEPVAPLVKTAAQALLESKRLLNSVAPVIDATYTTIDVAVSFVAYPGFDVAGVETAVEGALASYLSPATWGTPINASDPEWLVKAAVRYLEVAAVVDRVEGLDEITALTLGAVRAVTGVAATDVLTLAGHGYVLNDPVVLQSLVGGAGLVAGTTYYARDVTANTFTLASVPGGGAVDFTTDLTAATVRSLQPEDVPLAGAAPLTRPGTIIATGTAP